MSPLPRPVKAVLEEPGWDHGVVLGWARVQTKRRARRARRQQALGALAMVMVASVAGAVWFARRPAPAATLAPAQSPAPTAALDRLVGQLPHAQGRGVPAVRRPVSAPPSSSVDPAAIVEPEPQVDAVGALLESAREAYLAQQVPRAAALLSEVAQHHPEDSRSSQALYLLGRMQLERLHQSDAAALSFTRALELDPPAELVPTLWNALQRATGGDAIVDEAP